MEDKPDINSQLFSQHHDFLKAHLNISFHDAFFPYIKIPVRYILPASQVVKINPATNSIIEVSNWYQGTPLGMRPIITIGEVNGIMLAHTMMELSGVFKLLLIIMNAKMMGMVMGNISDCASCGSSFITLPMAANKEA